MATIYSTGTVTVTNGSATITGAGTLWINAAVPGDIFRIPGGPDYEVAAVTGDGAITLTANYAGTTQAGIAYQILKVSDLRHRTSTAVAQMQALLAKYGEVPVTASGTANALVLTTGTGLTALVDGFKAEFRAVSDNTGAATAAIDSVPASEILAPDHSSLVGKEIRDGGVYEVTYDEAAKSGAGALILSNPTSRAAISDYGVTLAEAVDAPAARGLLETGSLTGFRNDILNGDFSVWPEGTSGFTATGYTAAQWKLANGTGASNSIGRATLATGAVSKYALEWQRSVAGTAASVLFQPIEGVETRAEKTVTVTFFASSSLATEISVYLAQSFGTGGSPSATVFAVAQTVNLTPGMAKYALTFDLPSIVGKTLGTNGNDSLQVTFRRAHDATNPTATVFLTRVSHVEGDARQEADPFSARPAGMDDLLCKRYFEVLAQDLAFGDTALATSRGQWPFLVEKRVAPVITQVGGNSSVVSAIGTQGVHFSKALDTAQLGAGTTADSRI